MDLMKSR